MTAAPSDGASSGASAVLILGVDVGSVRRKGGAMVSSDGKPEPVDGMQDQADAVAAAERLAEILDATRAGLPTPKDVSCLPYGA